MQDKLSFYWFIILLLFAINGSSQISGTVYDESGEVLPFVTIYEEGTSTGTVSNMEGAYTLNVSKGERVIIFKYIGFSEHKEEVDLRDSLILNVTLSEETITVDEVVISADAEDLHRTGRLEQARDPAANDGPTNDDGPRARQHRQEARAQERSPTRSASASAPTIAPGSASTIAPAPNTLSRSCKSAVVSSASIATERCNKTGPVSKPASICIMHTPVSVSPAMMARWIGAAPRQRGNRLAWILRHPRVGASSTALGRIKP